MVPDPRRPRPGGRTLSDPLDAVFAALADPTRRWLITRLVAAGPSSATGLARDLPMSRQAVVHHLQTLAEAGLVVAERAGREVRWTAVTAPLAPARDWLEAAQPPPAARPRAAAARAASRVPKA